MSPFIPNEPEPSWKLAVIISTAMNILLFVIANYIIQEIIPLPSITEGWKIVYFQRNLFVIIIMLISLIVSGLFIISKYKEEKEKEQQK